MIDAHDYVTWDNVIGLEESKRFWYDDSRRYSYSISAL